MIPGLGRSPGGGNDNQLQKFHGRRTPAGYSPWGRERVRHRLVAKQRCMYADICVCVHVCVCVCVCVHQYIHTQRHTYIHIYDFSCVQNSKDYSLKQVRHFHNSFKRLLFKNGNSLEQMTGNHSSLQLTWRKLSNSWKFRHSSRNLAQKWA